MPENEKTYSERDGVKGEYRKDRPAGKVATAFYWFAHLLFVINSTAWHSRILTPN